MEKQLNFVAWSRQKIAVGGFFVKHDIDDIFKGVDKIDHKLAIELSTFLIDKDYMIVGKPFDAFVELDKERFLGLRYVIENQVQDGDDLVVAMGCHIEALYFTPDKPFETIVKEIKGHYESAGARFNGGPIH